MDRPVLTKVVPPAYFLIVIIVMTLAHLVIPGPRIAPYPWSLIGLAPLAAGLALAFLGRRQFTRAGTAVRPFQPSTALVTSGLFSFSRNPMYLGVVLALTGFALLLGSLTPWLGVFAMFALLDRAFIVNEEKMMEATFGAAYQQYRALVRRWI
jgi:protein-S-isoprenylcysteine O-methyltransferase Ste14